VQPPSPSAILARPAVRRGATALLFVGITLALTRAAVFPLDHLPVRDGNFRDAGQMCWNLWHVAESLSRLENPLVTDRVFHPLGANLATHTLSVAWAPLGLLVKAATRSDVRYPVYAYKAALFLSFLFLLLFTYGAIREAGFGFFAALIPACAYAFCDFYAEHVMHLNLLGGFVVPLSAWLALRLYRRPSAARATALAAALALGVYLSEFALFALVGLALFVLLALALPGSRRELLGRLAALGWRSVGAAVLVFAAIVLPFVAAFLASDAAAPEARWHDSLSTNVAALFVPHPERTPLYGELFASLDSEITVGLTGFEAFLGFPFLLAALLGALQARNRFAILVSLVGGFFLVLSFGPTLKVFGTDTGVPLPYGLLMELPLFEQHRAPVRFVAVGMGLLTFLAALGIEGALSRLGRLGGRALGTAVALAWLGWTLAEVRNADGPAAVPVAVPADLDSRLRDGPTVQWPIPSNLGTQMVLQTFHGRPVLNAFLARLSPEQKALVKRIEKAGRGDPERFAEALRAEGYANLLIFQRVPFEERRRLRELPFHVVEAFPAPQRLLAVAGGAVASATAGEAEVRVADSGVEGHQFVVELGDRIRADELEVHLGSRVPLRAEFFDDEEPVGAVEIAPYVRRKKRSWRFVPLAGVLGGVGFDRVVFSLPGEREAKAVTAVFTAY
jgi:hypothetical protein